MIDYSLLKLDKEERSIESCWDLALKNIDVVEKLVNKYSKRNEPLFEDFIHEGLIGFFQAIRNFESKDISSFLHYAKTYIRGQLISTLAKERYIKICNNMFTKMRKDDNPSSEAIRYAQAAVGKQRVHREERDLVDVERKEDDQNSEKINYLLFELSQLKDKKQEFILRNIYNLNEYNLNEKELAKHYNKHFKSIQVLKVRGQRELAKKMKEKYGEENTLS